MNFLDHAIREHGHVSTAAHAFIGELCQASVYPTRMTINTSACIGTRGDTACTRDLGIEVLLWRTNEFDSVVDCFRRRRDQGSSRQVSITLAGVPVDIINMESEQA